MIGGGYSHVVTIPISGNMPAVWECKEWCKENIGEEHLWRIDIDLDADVVHYGFTRAKHAILFKMTWC